MNGRVSLRERRRPNATGAAGPRVVRGGSWRDRPKRCRSAYRLSYPAWRRVFNVGFRVVAEERLSAARTAKLSPVR